MFDVIAITSVDVWPGFGHPIWQLVFRFTAQGSRLADIEGRENPKSSLKYQHVPCKMELSKNAWPRSMPGVFEEAQDTE